MVVPRLLGRAGSRRLVAVAALSFCSNAAIVIGDDVLRFCNPGGTSRYGGATNDQIAQWERSSSWCDERVHVNWLEDDRPLRSEAEIAASEPTNWQLENGGGGNTRCFGAWGTYDITVVGWPLRCAKASSFRHSNYPEPTGQGSNVITLPKCLQPHRSYYGYPEQLTQIDIRTAPIWSGLAADAAAHAAIWMLPIAGITAWRRRNRRGHCSHCNYDLHATPPSLPCPECGATDSRPVTPAPPTTSTLNA